MTDGLIMLMLVGGMLGITCVLYKIKKGWFD